MHKHSTKISKESIVYFPCFVPAVAMSVLLSLMYIIYVYIMIFVFQSLLSFIILGVISIIFLLLLCFLYKLSKEKVIVDFFGIIFLSEFKKRNIKILWSEIYKIQYCRDGYYGRDFYTIFYKQENNKKRITLLLCGIEQCEFERFFPELVMIERKL